MDVCNTDRPVKAAASCAGDPAEVSPVPVVYLPSMLRTLLADDGCGEEGSQPAGWQLRKQSELSSAEVIRLPVSFWLPLRMWAGWIADRSEPLQSTRLL